MAGVSAHNLLQAIGENINYDCTWFVFKTEAFSWCRLLRFSSCGVISSCLTRWQKMDNSSNDSASVCGLEGRKETYFVCYSLILLTSLCGNCIVTIIIYRSPRMKTTTNFIIANMAISDLWLLVFMLPKKIIWILNGGENQTELWLVHGEFGNVLCKLSSFIHDASFSVSMQSLVVIAVDRFFAVVFPLRPPILSKKNCPLVIAFTWIIATIIHIPYFLAFRLQYQQNDAYCSFKWDLAFTESDSLKHYMTFLLTAVFVVPLLVILILYSVIAYDLIKRSIGGVNGNNCTRQRREKENRNVTKMLITIVAAFTISFTPNFILMTWFLYVPEDKNSLSPCTITVMKDIRDFCFHSNGAINPIIYFIFSENYRQGLKSVFSALCSCCPPIPSQSRRLEVVGDDHETSTTRIQTSVELKRLSFDVSPSSVKLLTTSYRDLMPNGFHRASDLHLQESVL